MKLATCLICDDIRTELGNKLSLMGIYNDAVIFSPDTNKGEVWPQVLRLGFFIRLLLEEKDKDYDSFDFELVSEFEGEKQTIANGNLKLDDKSKTAITLSIIRNPFIVTKEGTAIFKLIWKSANDGTQELVLPSLKFTIGK